MAITTPPFRTSLLTQNGAPFGTDSGDVQTTKDWWLYWQQLTGRSNANSLLAGEGSHADRPDPGSMPDGAIYIEADRGAIYSNEGGTWQYIAGTMYGTLSPDQRPTDLGTHDAGFEFRGTDVARQFIWSQTAWLEVTAVQYGTHANRPNPTTIVDGALYVESDRGGVIYQRETPAGTPLWQYLAGTMWGTLVPDQRPTDLGAHDAGFDFRTNVAPPREFIWNQTAWVEITALVDPTTTKGDLIARGVAAPATRLAVGADGQVLTADAASTLGVKWGTAQAGLLQYTTGSVVTLTTTMTDIGLALTLPRTGTHLVIAVVDFVLNAGDANLEAQLVVAGSPTGVHATFSSSGSGRATAAQQWSVTAGSINTAIKIQAAKQSGSAGSIVTNLSSLSALWVSP